MVVTCLDNHTFVADSISGAEEAVQQWSGNGLAAFAPPVFEIYLGWVISVCCGAGRSNNSKCLAGGDPLLNSTIDF